MTLADQLKAWLATPQGIEALQAVLKDIDHTTADLQARRELDAITRSRPMTL